MGDLSKVTGPADKRVPLVAMTADDVTLYADSLEGMAAELGEAVAALAPRDDVGLVEIIGALRRRRHWLVGEVEALREVVVQANAARSRQMAEALAAEFGRAERLYPATPVRPALTVVK